jgi:hypothetical protein
VERLYNGQCQRERHAVPEALPPRRGGGLQRGQMKPARIILTVLVLAGVPLGVFTVTRGTAPTHHVASAASVERRFKAELRREHASNITCSRTLSGLGVTCSGQVQGSSSTTLYELGAIVTP